MDIKSYKSSGILERYVIGQASVEEIGEVEQYAAEHEEIRAEIELIRKTLEDYARAHQLPPPDGLLDKILDKIDDPGQMPDSPKIPAATEAPKDAADTTPRKTNIFQWLAAASVILLVASGILNIYQHQKLTEVRRQMAALESERTELAQDMDVMKANYELDKKDMSVIRDPDMQAIPMKGLEISPESFAMVYWSSASKEVYLDINFLPRPPSDKQYQLWAIVDGKPVSMGVFDVDPDQTRLQKMVSMENPQAFAVTLEKKCGSETPTLEMMYVLGNV